MSEYDNLSQAPPAYGVYNSDNFDNEGNQHYDQVALAWASAPPSYDTIYNDTPGRDLEDSGVEKNDNEPAELSRRESTLEPERDFAEMSRLRRKLCRWSIGMFICNLSLVLIGQIALSRSVGPYAIGNFITLGCFAIGALAFWSDASLSTRNSQVNGAIVYYTFLWLSLLSGVVAGFYYMATMDARIDKVCETEQFAERCEGNREALPWLALSACVICIILWQVVFGILTRVAFVYICAIERAHGAQSAAKIAAWVRCSALAMPDFHGWGRDLSNCCAASAKYICCAVTFASLIFSAVMCSAGFVVFCFVYDMLYLCILIAFDNEGY